MGFASGERFDRYIIGDRLGRGGMGEVYRARDTRLERWVALKILPPDTVAGGSAEESRMRLLREARAAAALDHPNVVAIFDVGEADGTTFLAMELIRGQSLRDYVGAAVPTARRLGWLADVARALAAAHKRGLVHRDIKPENVMVREDGVVKVLDFGIARKSTQLSEHTARIVAGPAAPTLTHDGLVGTPLYMAPEQLRGDAADGRADQFAWGVVAYELSTGRLPWPFKGDLEAFVSEVLLEDPEPFGAAAADLPKAVQAIVMRALDRDRSRRFASMDELLAALERAVPGLRTGDAADLAVVRPSQTVIAPDPALVETIAAPAGALPPAPRRRRWQPAIAIALGAALAAGAALWMAKRPAPPATSAPAASSAPAPVRRAIAVLGFKNLSGKPDAAWIATALAEMLASEIGTGQQVRVIAPAQVARTKADLGLGDADILAADASARAGAQLGADVLVSGTYLAMGEKSGGRLRLDVRLQDAKTGDILLNASETGAEADLLDLVARVGAELRRALRLDRLSTADLAGVRASQAATPEAQRLYAEGVALLRTYDAAAARSLLERAVAADPRYALAHAALAEAYGALGFNDREKQAAQRAFELSEGLPRIERSVIEARYRGAQGEWLKVVAIQRALAEAFPDNVDHGLHLADAQIAAEKASDALATVAALRKLPPPLGDDPRIDLAEMRAHESAGDAQAMVRAGTAALAKPRVQAARHVAAEIEYFQGIAAANLGDWQGGRAAIEEARYTFEKAGDRRGLSRALSGLSLVDTWSGDYPAAIADARQAVEIAREIGDRPYLCTLLTNLSGVQGTLGALDDALASADESLPLACATTQKGTAQMTRGLAHALRGRLQEAGDAYLGSRDMFRVAGDVHLAAWAEAWRGEVLIEQARYAEAREVLTRSLTEREKGGFAQFATESRRLLAELALAEKKPAEAEALARKAIEPFVEREVACDRAAAEGIVAAALLAQGKQADAHALLETAKPRARRCQGAPVRLAFEVIAGADPALPREESERALTAARDEAKKRGYVGIALRAERALGLLELRAGARAAAKDRLARVMGEAKAKGYVRLAAEIEAELR